MSIQSTSSKKQLPLVVVKKKEQLEILPENKISIYAKHSDNKSIEEKTSFLNDTCLKDFKSEQIKSSLEFSNKISAPDNNENVSKKKQIVPQDDEKFDLSKDEKSEETEQTIKDQLLNENIIHKSPISNRSDVIINNSLFSNEKFPYFNSFSNIHEPILFGNKISEQQMDKKYTPATSLLKFSDDQNISLCKEELITYHNESNINKKKIKYPFTVGKISVLTQQDTETERNVLFNKKNFSLSKIKEEDNNTKPISISNNEEINFVSVNKLEDKSTYNFIDQITNMNSKKIVSAPSNLDISSFKEDKRTGSLYNAENPFLRAYFSSLPEVNESMTNNIINQQLSNKNINEMEISPNTSSNQIKMTNEFSAFNNNFFKSHTNVAQSKQSKIN
jgi:ribosomal protein S4E